MEITHLGHSTVLVDVAGTRLLIDPGTFSSAWHEVTDIDVVLVTHQHPDHADPQHLPELLRNQPDAKVHVEPQVLNMFPLPERAEALAAGGVLRLGAVTVTAAGGRHAVIHRDIPVVGNIGLVIECPGEPTVFHPGDALDALPAGIDVALVPAFGPWAAMKETVDFLRALQAPEGFLIHDGLLNDRGYALLKRQLGVLCTDTTLVEVRDSRPWQLG